MNIRLSWGILLLIALLLTGCFDSTDPAPIPDSPADLQQDPAGDVAGNEIPSAPIPDSPADLQHDPAGDVAGNEIPPVYIYNLPDRWNAAAADVLPETEHHDIGRFEVTTMSESLVIHHTWGDERNDTYVKLTGYARKDDGRIDRMYIFGKQTNFNDQHLRHLQPYYEILIAASNPGLPPDERSGLMSELSLDGDAATLAERSDEDGKNTVSKHTIQYDVAAIASSEGITFALIVTMDAACNGDSILSNCR